MSTPFMVSSLLSALAALCIGAAVTAMTLVKSDACIPVLADCRPQPVAGRRAAAESAPLEE